MIGLLAGRPGVYTSLSDMVTRLLPGSQWADYRPALIEHLESSDPEETVDVGLEGAKAVRFAPGPGGTSLTAYTWGEGLWSVDSYGVPKPCTIFDLEPGASERERFLSLRIAEPTQSRTLHMQLPSSKLPEESPGIDIYSRFSRDEGYDHVARLVPSAAQADALTGNSLGNDSTEPAAMEHARAIAVGLPTHIPEGQYLACLVTEDFPNTICGQFTLSDRTASEP
ncbi:hypothetical protein [Ornithinimicrobium cavernae]|uniref:hypothetical protein n=1 Tax=Ornithinimicrobium cavernae TaxID=2666047 RepID=UPI000D68E9C8|nr:hypothetical protein [Ornithinimicrobium cavernae]